MSDESPINFESLGLPKEILQALNDVGYETPSPIQAETIPFLLEGHDVLGQAQTGTGKTAAFALPIVAKIDLSKNKPQAFVLTPTRELTIQVAEAFQKYAAHRSGFHVLPIYGGQNYSTQIRSLKRGVHVVVGTPGRVMDHMRKGTLDLSGLDTLVLDEADEMLRMGFIEDVEWILEQTPQERQIALFSATMPNEIKRIASNYLNKPKEVTIKVKTQTASTIRQRVWMVSGLHKLDALTRILETEPFDGMIIFVRTKLATEELAEKLQARGYAAEALNGDMQQTLRARTITSLKSGRIDILVATDVAARGLDVERISHVVNYDIPHDTESYVHRIGRTGRAGREGEAILFASPRERRMLKSIERATNQRIDELTLPTTQDVNDARIGRFKDRITQVLSEESDLSLFQELIEQYQNEHNVPAIEIAAALAKLVQGDDPLLMKESEKKASKPRREQSDRDNFGEPDDNRRTPSRRRERNDESEGLGQIKMDTYRIAVGHDHGVEPKHIVGAIANEADLESRFIGGIEIFDDYSLVSLPSGMPKEVLRHLQKARIMGIPSQMALVEGGEMPSGQQKGRRSGSASDSERPRRGKPDFKKKASADRGSDKGRSRKPPRD